MTSRTLAKQLIALAKRPKTLANVTLAKSLIGKITAIQLKSNSSTNWKMFDFFFWSSWCTMRVNRELALCTSEDGISWWLESMDCLFGNNRAKFHRRSTRVIATPPCKIWFFIFSLHVSRQKLGWNFMSDRFLSFTLIFFWLQSVSTDMKCY